MVFLPSMWNDSKEHSISDWWSCLFFKYFHMCDVQMYFPREFLREANQLHTLSLSLVHILYRSYKENSFGYFRSKSLIGISQVFGESLTSSLLIIIVIHKCMIDTIWFKSGKFTRCLEVLAKFHHNLLFMLASAQIYF